MRKEIAIIALLVVITFMGASLGAKECDDVCIMATAKGEETPPEPLETVTPAEPCTKIPPCSCPGRACIRISGGSWER